MQISCSPESHRVPTPLSPRCLERKKKKKKEQAISLKKNNTPDCAVMDYVFRLTGASVSGIFDGILMELVTELRIRAAGKKKKEKKPDRIPRSMLCAL